MQEHNHLCMCKLIAKTYYEVHHQMVHKCEVVVQFLQSEMD